jgi:hypothetical protein
MNRREFLKSLAALGASISVPCGSLAAASDAVIEEAWVATIQDPVTFYVSPWGTLSYGAAENWPQSREQLLGISLVNTLDELFSLADDNWRVNDLLESEWADRIEGEDLSYEDPHWHAWLERQPRETIDEFIACANTWIEDDADETDWEVADLRGYSDRGAAKVFFESQFEFNDDFNIVIVDGDHPGSTYFAAELRMDVDEANDLARDMKLPIRFEWSGD